MTGIVIRSVKLSARRIAGAIRAIETRARPAWKPAAKPPWFNGVVVSEVVSVELGGVSAKASMVINGSPINEVAIG